jgi:hypothetical protein
MTRTGRRTAAWPDRRQAPLRASSTGLPRRPEARPIGAVSIEDAAISACVLDPLVPSSSQPSLGDRKVPDRRTLPTTQHMRADLENHQCREAAEVLRKSISIEAVSFK